MPAYTLQAVLRRPDFSTPHGEHYRTVTVSALEVVGVDDREFRELLGDIWNDGWVEPRKAAIEMFPSRDPKAEPGEHLEAWVIVPGPRSPRYG